MKEAERNPTQPSNRRYRWPWFVLAAVLLAIILAVLWVSKEVQRTRQRKEFGLFLIPNPNLNPDLLPPHAADLTPTMGYARAARIRLGLGLGALNLTFPTFSSRTEHFQSRWS